MPDISFVIPFRNEEAFLHQTLKSVAEQDLGDVSAEVLLVDGASTDASREVIEPFLANSNNRLTFRLLDNPSRTTPFAFNIGIAAATSDIIGFGGAHTKYPPRYLSRAVELLRESGADVVGGGHDQFVTNETGVLAAAITCLYQSPMGAGVAAYHRRTTPGFVDTVYGGFYRRQVFARVGGFNEKLTRNQDNELNARVCNAGFRILFHPELSTSYVQKTDFKTFIRRGTIFGRYHPITWRTNPRSFRLRHATPAAFLLYLVVLAVSAIVRPVPWWLLAPAATYLGLLVYSAVQLRKRVGVAPAIVTIPVFSLFHLSYGLGTWIGLLSMLHVDLPNGGQRRPA
jgi:glycosyltransferase involved in cell wall biosynthesis